MSTQAKNASQQMLHIATFVASHGFAVVAIGYGGCSMPGCNGCRSRYPFTYTIGMVERGQPELMLFGLEPESAHFGISWVANEALAGRPVPVDMPMEVNNVAIKLVDVPNQWLIADRSRMAMWFNHYGPGRERLTEPAVRQLVWADADGRFPDDPSCNPKIAAMQPVLKVDPHRYPKIKPRRISSHRKRKKRR